MGRVYALEAGHAPAEGEDDGRNAGIQAVRAACAGRAGAKPRHHHGHAACIRSVWHKNVSAFLASKHSPSPTTATQPAAT